MVKPRQLLYIGVPLHVYIISNALRNHGKRIQDEVAQLRSQLQQRNEAGELSPMASPMAIAAVKGERSEDFLPILENLSQEINENVEERINLQKKLYEIDDSIALAAAELENLRRDDVRNHTLKFCQHNFEYSVAEIQIAITAFYLS